VESVVLIVCSYFDFSLDLDHECDVLRDYSLKPHLVVTKTPISQSCLKTADFGYASVRMLAEQ